MALPLTGNFWLSSALMPGVIVTAVAFDVCQVRVDSWPRWTEFGLAVKLLIWGGVTGVATVTVAVAVAWPPLPLAEIVYVVVADGFTCAEPLRLTLPTPWSIEAELAPEIFQARVDAWPALIVGGAAVKVIVGFGLLGASA